MVGQETEIRQLWRPGAGWEGEICCLWSPVAGCEDEIGYLLASVAGRDRRDLTPSCAGAQTAMGENEKHGKKKEIGK
jgi:hypothetical protein